MNRLKKWTIYLWESYEADAQFDSDGIPMAEQLWRYQPHWVLNCRTIWADFAERNPRLEILYPKIKQKIEINKKYFLTLKSLYIYL